MQLWTIQDSEAFETLETTGRLVADYRKADIHLLHVYAWMSKQLVRRGLCDTPTNPIWAWHSFGRLGAPPDMRDSSNRPGRLDHYKIKLDAPDDLVLLSDCDELWWHVLSHLCIDCQTHVHEFADSGQCACGHRSLYATWNRVFDIDAKVRQGRLRTGRRLWIQACLPYLDREWVVSAKKYKGHKRA